MELEVPSGTRANRSTLLFAKFSESVVDFQRSILENLFQDHQEPKRPWKIGSATTLNPLKKYSGVNPTQFSRRVITRGFTVKHVLDLESVSTPSDRKL